MEDNIMQYSDEYQDYKGDYDKFEYDVIDSNGNEILNCYPNGGNFSSMSDDKTVNEEFVKKIRFSNKPISYLNYDVSKICKEFVDSGEYDKYLESVDKKDCCHKCGNENVYKYDGQSRAWCASCLGINLDEDGNFIGIKTEPYIREEKKINRNDICTCGSGKKYKKCCIK